jgi:adenosylmethionine-8-amino-7-oxononanoate aminotransferase
VKDATTGEPFSRPEGEAVLRGFLAPRLYELGVIARTDDRGQPVVQLAPPLVAGDAELDVLTERVHQALTEAATKFCT